nr:amino acid racemase [Oceaniradius stylonematis]
MVGGMSWHSTAHYYRLLNEISENRHGPRMNAESILVTLPFAPLVRAMEEGDRTGVADRIAVAARQAERAGAGCLLLTAFTAHFAAPAVREAITVPLINAYDALADAAGRQGVTRLGVLGTRHTLADPQLAARLRQAGIDPVMPTSDTASRIDMTIAEELIAGKTSQRAGNALDTAVADLARQGAQAVALACTELPLLLPRQAAVPLIDGVETHVLHALNTLERME